MLLLLYVFILTFYFHNLLLIGLFPSAIMISENGGLVTFQIPKDEMKMGVAFTQLEKNRETLGIEDYSIAQPTLEQVLYEKKNL